MLKLSPVCEVFNIERLQLARMLQIEDVYSEIYMQNCDRCHANRIHKH